MDFSRFPIPSLKGPGSGEVSIFLICFIMTNLVTLYAMIKQVLMPVDKPSGMITSTLARRDFKAKL